MGTRATYRIKEASNNCGFNRSQSKYFYIHWDGYPEGAADYFKQMQNNLEILKVKHSFHADGEFELKFGKAIVAFGMIGPAEFTENHEEHGHTDFQYNLFYSHKTDNWEVEAVQIKRWNEDRVVRKTTIFDGTLNEFFDKFYKKKGNQMTYNGWTNRSTWALHLNLSNEEITRERYAECKCVQDILDLWNDYFSLDHDRVILGEVNFSELIERLEFERAL